jgi:hypothetical protein
MDAVDKKIFQTEHKNEISCNYAVPMELKFDERVKSPI